jgi:hypothetical protein
MLIKEIISGIGGTFLVNNNRWEALKKLKMASLNLGEMETLHKVATKWSPHTASVSNSYRS